MVRSGGTIYDNTGKVSFNPFLDVKKNAKVVVYSSGSFGQHILSTNAKTNFFQIIRWIDLDHHELNVGGNFVKPLSSIDNKEFDSLIIATINPSTYDAIKAELILMGIDEKKIVKINVDEVRKSYDLRDIDSVFSYVSYYNQYLNNGRIKVSWTNKKQNLFNIFFTHDPLSLG